MVSTSSKTWVRLSEQGKWRVVLKRQGEVRIIESEDPKESYVDYCGLINADQWRVGPNRP